MRFDRLGQVIVDGLGQHAKAGHPMGNFNEAFPNEIEKMEFAEDWQSPCNPMQSVFLRYVKLSTRYYTKELEGVVPSKRLQELTEPLAKDCNRRWWSIFNLQSWLS